jgi:FlgD Ig-like domain
VNPDAARTELYTFNNRLLTSLPIREDSTAPEVVVIVEGRRVSGSTYAPEEPLIQVLLTDNSLLPIGDSTRLNVFINGDRMRPAVVKEWQFLATEQAQEQFGQIVPGVRAAMQFRYRLEEGQNNLLIRSEDATGNKDTSMITLNVAAQASIAGVVVSPQPAQGPVSFTIEHAGLTASHGTLVILDGQGRLVRRLPLLLNVGLTVMVWDGLTEKGSSLSSGTYHFRVELDDDDGAVRTGTFMILR